MPPSAVVLVAANLVPLAGVVAFHWTVLSVLLLYWFENVVVGGLNVLKMACANPRSIAADAIKLFLIPFFIVHYGMFTSVHGMIILAVFGHASRLSPSAATFIAALRSAGVGYGALAIAVSHGFSFAHNYLWGGEFRRADPRALMFQPYARVMVLHAATLIGGFGAQVLGSPAVALVVLVALKTGIDLRAHLAERRKLGAAAALPQPPAGPARGVTAPAGSSPVPRRAPPGS
ncbi:MAG TPA: DUF6498-containing protein [Gemmatimonadales bacterium]|nr:DUF6498-containing protein [Gemmatimonadales bacterium]